MKEGRTSGTAEGAAAIRAEHYLYESPTIFEDPFALAFTSPVLRRIIVTKPLRWFVNLVSPRWMHLLSGEVVVRSRYAEDHLEQAIAAGVRQYVIVGAGFDSFALRRRDLEPTVRVFELDHRDTQRAKRQRLLTLGVELPNNVEFVEIDFERESAADALTPSSYQPTRPAFFSWLGTTFYLSNAATIGTLRSITGLAATGSEVVFDYLVPEEVLSREDARLVERMKRYAARRGEPMVGEFHPTELQGALRSIGLELIENLSGAELEKRYFANRHDGMRLTPFAFAHARIAQSAA